MASYDIASPDDQHRVRELADQLRASPSTPTGGVAVTTTVGIDEALADKLAQSKGALETSAWSGTLAVVFAMWGEQRRLLPRSADNPTGEDSLNTKLDQLAWLFDGSNVDWSLIAVDDGDPDDSAAVAIEAARRHREKDRVTVLRLADAIPAGSGPLASLAHVDDSRKGGAIALGAHHAIGAGADVVVITDADNSVDLGQIGLLLQPFSNGAGVVIGDRKHADSVLVKAEARWGPGIVVLRHIQRMVGHALFDRGLRDTQAAFKLYRREALEAILAAPSTFGFSFDSDWLFAAVAAGERIERVPFAFIDSFEESASITQGPMTTWESLLTGLVAAARARGADHDEEMALVVDDLVTAETLERVIEQVPDELAEATDTQLGQRSVMTPQQLRTWLESVTTA
ncbi:MAG: glycosyltransferase family 2 protein [Actinomycetia bacterium]|nr:glycosyltransferase family 2 protein [Actinomycetes bacterium]